MPKLVREEEQKFIRILLNEGRHATQQIEFWEDEKGNVYKHV